MAHRAHLVRQISSSLSHAARWKERKKPIDEPESAVLSRRCLIALSTLSSSLAEASYESPDRAQLPVTETRFSLANRAYRIDIEYAVVELESR